MSRGGGRNGDEEAREQASEGTNPRQSEAAVAHDPPG